MKLKELESHLQQVDEFDEPKILLEQFTLPDLHRGLYDSYYEE